MTGDLVNKHEWVFLTGFKSIYILGEGWEKVEGEKKGRDKGERREKKSISTHF